MFLNEESSRNRSQPKHHTSWIKKIWPNKTQKQWILFLIFVLFLLVKLTAFQKLDLNKMVESNNHTCLNRYCASKFAIYIHCERQMNVRTGNQRNYRMTNRKAWSTSYRKFGLRIAGLTVMKNHRITVENPPNSMANELLDNSIMVFICMITLRRN